MNSEKVCNLHRSLLLVSGERSRVFEVMRQSIHHLEKNVLLVSNDAVDGLASVTYKQASTFLGQEKKAVVFDLYNGIHPDALAAVTGLISGGGFLILCLPPVAMWDSVFSSSFSKRFIRQLNSATFVKAIDIETENCSQVINNALTAFKTESVFELTTDQENVVENIVDLLNTTDKQSLVVVSDRGRGKSTSLGLAATKLLKEKTVKILLTAPRLKACDAVFSALNTFMSDADIKQAGVHYQQSVLQYMAPDEILRTDVSADILFIDEAASIPLPLLKQLLERFDKTVFVSTVHGYEGTGRGFSVRFSQTLDESINSWQRIEMKTPVRWAANDPLEEWLFGSLCLDADVAKFEKPVDIESIEIMQITSAELLTNESLLRNIFSLLVLAHYKTRPSDLQRMLDDPVIITIAKSEGEAIAVVLSADEGGFDQDLSTAIYQGVRRPPGNLLAQTLTYHCGIEEAATAISHRIMRVVVHPECQSQGVGTQLLNYLEQTMKNRSVDIIGTSFGLTQGLSRFWENSDFEIVRVGLKKEQTSGEHAAVYIKSLTDKGLLVVNKARERFIRHWPLLKISALSDLDVSFLKLPKRASVLQMTETEQEDIKSFVKYSRAYELCIAGVDKFVDSKLNLLANPEEKKLHDILVNVTQHKMNWKNTAKEMSLDGKKQAQTLFKRAVVHLWEKYNK